jgi:ribosomal protein L12E/L44/L45/RPP1/RPP2
MKKIMTLMLGLSLALGTVAVSFAQETPKKGDDKKDTKKKKSSKKKKEGDAPKKS